MKKIFIDTENISNYSCLNLINISKKDEITLFLTRNSKPMKAENLHIVHSFESKVRTLLFEPTGHNALDFHIVTHLGLKHSAKNEYYIVSNDKGYEASKNHFNTLGYNNVYIVGEQSRIDNDKNIINPTKSLNIDELELRRIFKDHKDKSDFHNKLVSEFGEDGKIMYREYKKKYS